MFIEQRHVNVLQFRQSTSVFLLLRCQSNRLIFFLVTTAMTVTEYIYRPSQNVAAVAAHFTLVYFACMVISLQIFTVPFVV